MTDDSWRTATFRQSVVSKIDEAIRQSQMPTSRNSMEMENHVFQKAKTKEEYLGFVARLILHVREMNTPPAKIECASGARNNSFMQNQSSARKLIPVNCRRSDPVMLDFFRDMIRTIDGRPSNQNILHCPIHDIQRMENGTTLQQSRKRMTVANLHEEIATDTECKKARLKSKEDYMAQNNSQKHKILQMELQIKQNTLEENKNYYTLQQKEKSIQIEILEYQKKMLHIELETKLRQFEATFGLKFDHLEK